MSTTRVVEGQDTAWRYRCQNCGYRRSGHRDEMDDIRTKHEEECSMAQNVGVHPETGFYHHFDPEAAWAALDAQAEKIYMLVASLNDGAIPPDRIPVLTEELNAAKIYARGGSAVLAQAFGVKPETISAEAGLRYQARKAGKIRRVLSSNELRGRHETPLLEGDAQNLDAKAVA